MAPVPDRLVLLPPGCPRQDDPEIRKLLKLVASLSCSLWAALELHPEGLPACREYFAGDMTSEPVVTLDLSRPGVYRATLTIAPIDEVDAALRELAALALDRLLAVRKLREQTAILRGALDATASAILLFAASGEIVYANPPADELLSRQTATTLEVVKRDAASEPLITALCSLVDSVVSGDHDRSSWVGSLPLSDGTTLACEVIRVSVPDLDGRLGVLVQLTAAELVAARNLDLFALVHQLSRREEEVVAFLQRGLTTTDIAAELGISQHTVRDHVKHVYRKTGASTRAELLSMLNHAALATTLSPRT